MSYISTYEALLDAFNAQVNEAVSSISEAGGEGKTYSHKSLQKLLDALPEEFWQTGPYHDANDYATWLSSEEQPRSAPEWEPLKAMLWGEGAGVVRASAEALSLDVINSRMAMIAPATSKAATSAKPGTSQTFQTMPRIDLGISPSENADDKSGSGIGIAVGIVLGLEAVATGIWLWFRSKGARA